MKAIGRLGLFVLIMLVQANGYAHDSLGVSIGGDVEDDSQGTRLFELNYESRSRYVSAYLGYASFDVPAAYDSTFATSRGVVETRGAQGAVLFHFDNTVLQPYLGAGVYAGNIDTCTDRFSGIICKTEETYAFYPEAGVRLKLGRHLLITGKVRYYDFDREEIQDETVASMSIGYFF